jgi:hypothetical protein
MSLILADPPTATATPAWAQEPPPGPQLSDEEQKAIDARRAGKPHDEDAATRAQIKLDTQEKYNRERNKQKQRGQPRRTR